MLERNISALLARRRAEDQRRGIGERLAATISRGVGSMAFVLVHLALVAMWLAINLGWTPLRPFDPTFVVLGMIASVEAIFISTFVLITQNRLAVEVDRRADLDLQISLLAEHEITRLIQLTALIGEKIGVQESRDPALESLKRDVAPEQVLDRLELAERERQAEGKE